jgi:NADPH-dependent glutamate synthase beta subunit-like oxidoreductase
MYEIVVMIYSRRVPPCTYDETKYGTPTSESHLPVPMIGAGPTGFTLAIVLARYGVTVRVVEQKPLVAPH